MKPGVEARRAASTVVGRVMRSGAYSNRLVEATSLRGQDADLFRFLTYTTLRHLLTVDGVVEKHSAKKLTSIDDEVVDILRVAVAELLYGRAPVHAVVDSAVESTKTGTKRRASGFVNGMLRAIVRSGESDQVRSPRNEYPAWIVEKLDGAWEASQVEGFLVASLGEAPRQVRARPGARADMLTPVPGITDSFGWALDGDIPEGFVVQDAASVAVGNAVPAEKGDLVLDMAASPGGKVAHLHDRGFRVVAVDRNRRRTRTGRSRVPSIPWATADGRIPPFRSGSFDHVLLDAPCSGLGTMRRRPEVRYRSNQEDVSRMSKVQRSLIDSALTLVKPGGTVTYSVCTVTPEETVEVVANYEAAAPAGLPGMKWGRGILLGPHLTESDGMFISVLSRP